jgi:hypothetical protein
MTVGEASGAATQLSSVTGDIHLRVNFGATLHVVCCVHYTVLCTLHCTATAVLVHVQLYRYGTQSQTPLSVSDSDTKLAGPGFAKNVSPAQIT